MVVHIVGAVAFLSSLAWALREHYRFKDRVPLVQLGTGQVLLVGVLMSLAVVAAVVGMAHYLGNIVQAPLPTILAAFGWMSGVIVAGAWGMIAWMQSLFAQGWLSFSGPHAVRIELGDLDKTIDIAPGVVDAAFVGVGSGMPLGVGSEVQVLLRAGDDIIPLIVRPKLAEMPLVRESMERPLESEGPTVSFAGGRLLQLIQPHLTERVSGS